MHNRIYTYITLELPTESNFVGQATEIYLYCRNTDTNFLKNS